MRKEKIAVAECPVETAMVLIGNKWKIFVLRELLDGTKRFNELQRSINGISQKVLTQNLRAMEKDGLVNRKVFAEVPPRGASKNLSIFSEGFYSSINRIL